MHEPATLPRPTTAPLTIRVATTPADWHAVHRLRYECFVAENGQAADTADHEHRLLGDAMDAVSTTLIGIEGDEIVGTVRYQADALERFPFRGLFGLETGRRDNEPSREAVISKLAVAASARGPRVTRALVCDVYQRNLDRGTTTAWLGCAPRLERFYLRLGLLPAGELQQVPGYGAIRPMRLQMRDLAHLQACGSPFAPLCAAFLAAARRSA